jgi:hypothetical protein
LKTFLIRVYRPKLGGNILKLKKRKGELNPNKNELGGNLN